jgi:hypothetical protein
MLPDSLSSLTQATSCLDSIMLHGYIHQDPVVCTPNYEQIGRENIKTQALLESWYNNLSRLLSQPQPNKSHLLQESITLKIKYHIELRVDDTQPNPTLALCLGLASMAHGYGRRKPSLTGLQR